LKVFWCSAPLRARGHRKQAVDQTFQTNRNQQLERCVVSSKEPFVKNPDAILSIGSRAHSEQGVGGYYWL
jgi:hypothetical protein